jgi:type IV secretion system protein VirB10
VQYIERPSPNPSSALIQGRLQEPALIIDLSQEADAGKGADQAHATIMRHRSMIIPQGTIIPAVLETPINSSAPGLVRAITSRDTSGFDGSRVLVPKGSRLFGEYQSNVRAGQSRVLVNWTNLVRPDGVSIKLSSPAADAGGGTGVPGAVNNHILARFTSAVLQSALAVGVNFAYRPAAGSVVIGAPIQAAASAGGTLIPDAQAEPTITVKEGADIAVLVARDLDFSGALPRL